MASGQERLVLRGHTETVLTGMFSFDGSLLATGSNDCTVTIWDSRTGLDRITFVPLRRYSVHSVAWSPDNKLLAAGYENSVAQLWELSSGRPQAQFSENTMSGCAPYASPRTAGRLPALATMGP